MGLESLQREIEKYANPEKVKIYKNFHKTHSDGYAKNESFMGITVPNIRKVALNNLDISYSDILKLLSSNVHEEKYVAAEIVAGKYKKEIEKRKEIFDFYINNADKFSGWDLVDTTSSQTILHFLFHFGKEYPIYKVLLTNLAKSSNIWSRRIAIVSTYYFIRNGKFQETLKISEILLKDNHDLIHKATGWMLRELGKRKVSVLDGFLRKNYKKMPRTMLRYSIEHFPEEKRQKYLKGEI